MLERLHDHHCHHSSFGSYQKSHRRHGVGFILAPGGGGCCDNDGVFYRIPVSSRHQRCERRGEKEARKILVLTSFTSRMQHKTNSSLNSFHSSIPGANLTGMCSDNEI